MWNIFWKITSGLGVTYAGWSEGIRETEREGDRKWYRLHECIFNLSHVGFQGAHGMLSLFIHLKCQTDYSNVWNVFLVFEINKQYICPSIYSSYQIDYFPLSFKCLWYKWWLFLQTLRYLHGGYTASKLFVPLPSLLCGFVTQCPAVEPGCAVEDICSSPPAITLHHMGLFMCRLFWTTGKKKSTNTPKEKSVQEIQLQETDSPPNLLWAHNGFACEPGWKDGPVVPPPLSTFTSEIVVNLLSLIWLPHTVSSKDFMSVHVWKYLHKYNYGVCWKPIWIRMSALIEKMCASSESTLQYYRIVFLLHKRVIDKFTRV